MIHWLKDRTRWTRYKNKIAHLPAGVSPHPLLDVGCGPFPIPGADFVADIERKLFDVPEMEARLKGRFVRCDIHHLPFATNTFSFAHCSNVLEHTEQPVQAFAELKRVASHGFAETPAAFFEKVINHSPRHLWIIRWKDERIIPVKPSGLWDTNIYLFSSATWWIRRKIPVLWKAIMIFLDVILNLAYNKFYW
ncbi:MAG: class I SAM-dependent methyltransferase [Chloroflexi bacterium]|nr:class I SAM-dependent methyltransferase [Chloroflexota bacterium]